MKEYNHNAIRVSCRPLQHCPHHRISEWERACRPTVVPVAPVGAIAPVVHSALVIGGGGAPGAMMPGTGARVVRLAL